MKVLVVGVGGMLGHVVFKALSRDSRYDVVGTARNLSSLRRSFSEEELSKIRGGVDAFNFDSLVGAFAATKPSVVINCVGIIKQLPEAKSPLISIAINAELPHKLAQLCEIRGARLVHISTDCVFKGDKGSYKESDQSDAEDLYGRTKFLGEIQDSGALTLRTSIIGHELRSNVSLVDWFLSQKGQVNGYENVIYTGFPTVEITRILLDVALPDSSLSGLYQVSSEPISKFELLKLIAKEYGKHIEIEPFADIKIDRSLDSSRFRERTGYRPPSWDRMVKDMHEHFLREKCYDTRQSSNL